MLKNTLTGLDKKKLRRWLLLFFFALAIPTAILIQQSYSRLKWETFHQHQLMADELSDRIDNELLRLINTEEQRSFTDYSFLNIAGDPKANLLQRSPLSNYPIESEIAGLIGYFQIDNQGRLKTPLLPEAIKLDTTGEIYGIAKKELLSRTEAQNQIQEILSQNSLVKAPPINTGADMTAFDSRIESAVESETQNRSILGSLLGENSSFNSTSGYESASDTVASESVQVVPNAQVAFDRLKTVAPKLAKRENKLGRIEDLNISKTYSKESTKNIKENLKKRSASKRRFANKSNKRIRKENNVLPESDLLRQATQKKSQGTTIFTEITEKSASLVNRIRTFESSIDPFEFSQLDSGHFVLYRNVWLNDKRYIQGLLINQKPFLNNLVNTPFRNTTLSQMSDLLVSYQGNILSAFSASDSKPKSKTYAVSGNSVLKGELLRQTRLSSPLSELQLLFSIKQLPVGAGGKIILWLSLLLSLVLCAGFYLMYRLGLGQINLANQQQDFVSAVSHELKTPLTSIRMYSEMLREGWASDEKKKNYYDFIFDESERLSRLINNVLHLARVTRNKQTPELKKLTVAELMDGIRSKVSTQIKHAGFELVIQCDEKVEHKTIHVDEDWFSQIMINLVDNAIKFSLKAEQQKIDLMCKKHKNGQIQISVRDYGQGVDKTQMKKIFDLFYRTESELTRETVGTGIGLALVHQMVVGMGGKIDVVNQTPGAEFRVLFSSDRQ